MMAIIPMEKAAPYASQKMIVSLWSLPYGSIWITVPGSTTKTWYMSSESLALITVIPLSLWFLERVLERSIEMMRVREATRNIKTVKVMLEIWLESTKGSSLWVIHPGAEKHTETEALCFKKKKFQAKKKHWPGIQESSCREESPGELSSP